MKGTRKTEQDWRPNKQNRQHWKAHSNADRLTSVWMTSLQYFLMPTFGWKLRALFLRCLITGRVRGVTVLCCCKRNYRTTWMLLKSTSFDKFQTKQIPFSQLFQLWKVFTRR
eukprot:Lithocolla_globosa_v1_NODE_2806_length_1863_cov_4.867810.p2 type:complete len:112 gc:universal NODE_2806_length_1863_cov_4.867810:938-603(-)